MSFIDEALIFVKAGDGGHGSASFLRTKHMMDGGPDGGHGGNGGNIIVQASKHINTLLDFKYKKKIMALDGQSGSGKLCKGKQGENIVLKVPIGTEVLSQSGDVVICDLNSDGNSFIIAHGGRGGAGNIAFKTSSNQAPQFGKAGREGEEGRFLLSLKVFSDIGLLGFPNAGKSSLINAVTNTKAKIGAYSFTTTEPALGFVEVENYDGFIMADIPGLVENASAGKGLGHRFLKHLERCKAFIHVIDVTEDNIANRYQTIMTELSKYSKTLPNKKQFIALNKVDLVDTDMLNSKIESLTSLTKQQIYPISTKTKSNTKQLMFDIFNYLKHCNTEHN